MRQRESHDLSGLFIDAQKCLRIPLSSSKIENFKKNYAITLIVLLLRFVSCLECILHPCSKGSWFCFGFRAYFAPLFWEFF